MAVKISNARSTHTFKSKSELLAYNRFLSESENSDPTVKEDKSVEHTNSSAFEKEEPIETLDIMPKSLKVRVVDFLKSNAVSSIAIGITIALFMVVLGIWTDQKYYVNKIKDLDDITKTLSSNYEKINSELSELDKEFGIFKIGISKDFEYLRIRLGL